MAVKPYKKWPYQRELVSGDDETGYLIYGRYCSPWIARLAHLLFIGTTFLLVLGFIFAGMDYEQWGWLGYGLVAVILNGALYRFGLYRGLLMLLIGPRFRIIITPQRIRFGSLIGYRSYDRYGEGGEIEVGRERHPKAALEQEKIKENQGKGKPYFSKTYQVIMRYGEHRRVVASIFDNEEKAGRLVTRLIAVAQKVDEQ